MEVSALTHAGAAGHARSPLLRLQSDERLIALIRRGNHHAFEALVARYQSRLLAFCRHMLSSREDAEDVLQEVFAAAFNAILADDRAINVRPWLYRIARNRSLNHLRKAQAIGVDSMDVHLSEHGLTTADKVHKREEFRQLMSDVQDLPETQRTALLLREIDALSYEQIAEAMETTVPSVKSLLVRARVSLAEAAEARLLTCEEVRDELGEVAEGLRRTTPPVRRHLRTCDRCQLLPQAAAPDQPALAAIFPVGPLLLLKKALLAHAGTARRRQRRRRGRGRRARPRPAPRRCGRGRRRRAAAPARARSPPRPSPASRPPRSSPPAPSRSSTSRTAPPRPRQGRTAQVAAAAAGAPPPHRPRARRRSPRRRSRSPSRSPRRRRRAQGARAADARARPRPSRDADADAHPGARRRAAGAAPVADADAGARRPAAPPNIEQHEGDTIALPSDPAAGQRADPDGLAPQPPRSPTPTPAPARADPGADRHAGAPPAPTP